MASAQLPTTMPLRCTLCPKQPAFSDISHLLTHVSSKGHLAVRHEYSLRADTDPVAAAIYFDFESWYSEWNINALLAERLQNKEKKLKGKASTSRSRTTARSSSLGSGRNQTRSLATTPSLPRSLSFQSPVPRPLSELPVSYGPNLKREGSHSPWTPYHSLAPRFGQPYNLRDSTLARVYDYADSPYASDYSAPSTYPEPPYDYDLVKSEGEPEKPSTTQGRKFRKVKAAEDSDDDLPCAPDDESDDNSRTTKLKGVIWPGMSIFDSATPSARKQRNQKKSANVIEQLETNSLGVENIESVWYADGILKKQKEISGLPSSSSPPPSPSITAAGDAGLAIADLDQLAHNAKANSPHPGAGVFNAHEFTQTHSATARRPKRTFEAYRDDDEEDAPATFAHPANMSHLIRGAPFGQARRNVVTQPARRRMPDGRKLDNRPYENMSPTLPAVQGKYAYPLPQMLYHHVPHGFGNTHQGFPSSNSGRERDVSYSPRPSPHAVASRAQASPASRPSSAHSQAPVHQALRGVGAQFAEIYNNPTIFTAHPPAMYQQSHGHRARKSASAIPIEDLVHNYAPANSTYLSSEQLQHLQYMHNPNQVYDPAMSASHHHATDHNNAWMAMQQHNEQVLAGLAAEAAGIVPDPVKHRARASVSIANASSPNMDRDAGDRADQANALITTDDHGQQEHNLADNGMPGKTASNPPVSTPVTATEDEGRTITAPPSSPCL